MSPVLAALALSLISAEPVPTQVEKADVSDRKARFHAFTDNKKHVLIVEFDKERTLPEWAFYGDGKTFYRLRVKGGGGEQGVSWNIALWEPRDPGAQAFIDYRAGKLNVTLFVRPRLQATAVHLGDVRHRRFGKGQRLIHRLFVECGVDGISFVVHRAAVWLVQWRRRV